MAGTRAESSVQGARPERGPSPSALAESKSHGRRKAASAVTASRENHRRPRSPIAPEGPIRRRSSHSPRAPAASKARKPRRPAMAENNAARPAPAEANTALWPEPAPGTLPEPDMGEQISFWVPFAYRRASFSGTRAKLE